MVQGHLHTGLLKQCLPVLGFEATHFGVHEEQFAAIPGGQATPLEHFTLVAERPS